MISRGRALVMPPTTQHLASQLLSYAASNSQHSRHLFSESEPASPFDWWVQHLGSNSNQCVDSPKSFSYSDNSRFVNILSNIQSLTTVNKLCKTAFSGVKVAALSLDYHSRELHDCSTSYTRADSDSKAIHLPFM